MSRQTDQQHPDQITFWPVSHKGRDYTMTTTYEEEDGSGGNNSPDKSHGSTRKRKATEDTGSGDPSEKDLKRQKNREAAKKCRDRKIQETESLRKKNEELEKENCQVVRQRDELMRRCLALEEQLQQHKEQGCELPDLSPPCRDLSHILDPSTPPSPSFSGSSSLSPSPPEGSPPQAYSASPVQAYSASPVQAYSASPVQAYSASPVQAYHASPVPGKYFETSTVGSNDIAKTLQSAGNPENRKWMTPTPRMAASVAQAAASASSQPAVHPAQAISSQHYPFHYRGKDGSTKTLQLDHENYMKVITNLKAIETESANQAGKQSDFAPVVCSPASPPSQSLTTQQVKEELMFELSSDAEHSTGSEFTAKTSAESSELDDMFSSQHDFLTLLDNLEDDRMKEDLRLVDPNDIFMKKMVPTDVRSDQPTDMFLEGESTAFQQKAPDNITTADSNAQMTSNQDLLAGQVKWRTDSDSFISADDPSLYHVQAENTDMPVTGEDSSLNDQIITITVTNPKTAEVVHQSSSQYSNIAGKFIQPLPNHRRVFQPIRPAPQGQTLSYATISANDLINTSGKPFQDVPIMIEKVRPALSTTSVGKLPAQTVFDVSDYQPPILDSLSEMKIVKLRSRTTELLAPTSGLRVSMKPSSQSHHAAAAAAAAAQSWAGRGNENSSMPLKERHIVNSSQTSGIQQASFSVLPTYHNVDLSQDLLQPSTPQPIGSQTPVILLSQSSNLKNEHNLPGKTPNPEADMRFTDSDRNLMDHLANVLIDGDVFLE